MATHFFRRGFVAIYKQHLQQQIVANKIAKPVFFRREFHVCPALCKHISFKLSDIGEGIREVTVKEWYVKVGDVVEQFDNLCEVQSDKASVTITSRYDGKITKLHYNVDEIAFVGKPLLDFDIENEEEEEIEATPSVEKAETTLSASTTATEALSDDITRQINLATPAVRRIARENNVDLSKVKATGKNSRVLKGDVLEYLGVVPPGTNIPHPTIAAKSSAQTTTTTTTQPPVDRVEKLKGVRKAMFKSMTETLKIPHFAYCDEIELSNLTNFRDQLRSIALEMSVPKLTFMPFFIKAASIALTKYPILNSSLDVENESVIYHGTHNISVAIDTPTGLVVPNVKNIQSKNIIEIARDLNALVERGRSDKLTTADFANGTFSLSNIGIIGGTYTHPCIMSPQVAIGAMGRTNIVPRFDAEGKVVKAQIMNVSWCADHRVIDGVTMAMFSNLWKQYLENPALFLLH